MKVLHAVRGLDARSPRHAGSDPCRRIRALANDRCSATTFALSIAEPLHARTGCPAMINTSFNVRGEPPVCTPADAYRCFMLTDMDALVIGHFVLLKSEQPRVTDQDRQRYLQEFKLD